MIVLDTNVLSEAMKPSPAEPVRTWAGRHSSTELHLTSITLAEIWFGIEQLPEGRRKAAVTEAAEQTLAGFSRRVLSFDAAAAREHARLLARRLAAGAPMSALDAQIAAVCRMHRAVLATRNVRDFRNAGIELVNPWEEAP